MKCAKNIWNYSKTDILQLQRSMKMNSTSAENDQELSELVADRGNNPDYGYIVRLFQEYRENTLGSSNGKKMFERLVLRYRSTDLLTVPQIIGDRKSTRL